jgi:hypothetical protein
MMGLTFYNGSHIVGSIPVAGKVLINLDSSLQLPAQQITFVQEENELSFSEKFGRTYGRP